MSITNKNSPLTRWLSIVKRDYYLANIIVYFYNYGVEQNYVLSMHNCKLSTEPLITTDVIVFFVLEFLLIYHLILFQLDSNRRYRNANRVTL